MGARHSSDLDGRISEWIDTHCDVTTTQDRIAKRWRVGRGYISRLPGYKRLKERQLAAIGEYMAAHPDATITELSQHTGVPIGIARKLRNRAPLTAALTTTKVVQPVVSGNGNGNGSLQHNLVEAAAHLAHASRIISDSYRRLEQLIGGTVDDA